MSADVRVGMGEDAWCMVLSAWCLVRDTGLIAFQLFKRLVVFNRLSLRWFNQCLNCLSAVQEVDSYRVTVDFRRDGTDEGCDGDDE